MSNHVHDWRLTGKHSLYIESTRVIRGQHQRDSVYATWVRCACGAKGYLRAPRRVVYTCEDWGHR